MSYGFLRRLSPSALSSRVEVPIPGARPLRLADVPPGSLVVDVAGNPVGEFIGVRGEDLEVSRGWLRTRLIRAEHVGELRVGVVRLAIHASELD